MYVCVRKDLNVFASSSLPVFRFFCYFFFPPDSDCNLETRERSRSVIVCSYRQGYKNKRARPTVRSEKNQTRAAAAVAVRRKHKSFGSLVAARASLTQVRSGTFRPIVYRVRIKLCESV